MVKYITFVFIFFISVKFYTQQISRYESDSIIVNEIVRNETLQDVESPSVTFYDDSGKMIQIISDKQKYKAYKQFYREKKMHRQKIKLSKEDIVNINNLLKNPEILDTTLNNDCSRIVHSFTKISIIIYNGTFYNGTFFSNCKQNKFIEPLKKLYFSLINTK